MSEQLPSEKLTAADLDNLRHMLGARSDNRKHDWGYRNHFCASTRGEDYESMVRLERHGFVKMGRRNLLNIYFHATEEGCKALGFNEKQINRALYDK